MTATIQAPLATKLEKAVDKTADVSEIGNSTEDHINKLGERPRCFKSTLREVSFTIVATTACATTSMLIGAIIVTSTFIAEDLHMTSAEIAWIPASSTLTSGAFLLGFGRLCDLVGRRSVLLCSLTILTILCIGTGFADSGIMLDVFNGLLGIAGGSAIPAALGILGAAYETPSKRKNYAFACFSAGNPLGFVVGMLVAGIATQLANWRASYWALSVIFALTTIAAVLSTPADECPRLLLSKEMFLKFDPLGIGLTLAGIALLSAGLTQGSEASDGWTTPYILFLLILGVLSIVGFVLFEFRYAYPLIPMSIWRDRNFTLLTVILSLGFLGLPIALFWTSLFLQMVWHLSALEVAIHLLPAAIMGTIVNIVAALILHKVSNKLLMGIGALAYTVSFVLLALNKTNSSYWAFIMPALALMVVGADFQFVVCIQYVMSGRATGDQSVSGAILQTITKLCSTVSFSIASAIFNAVQKEISSVRNKQPPQAPSSMPGDSHQGHAPPPDSSATAKPYSAIFWYCAAAAGLSLFLVPFLTIQTQGRQPAKTLVKHTRKDLLATNDKP